MSQLDTIAPHFSMAARRWKNAANLQAHYVDLNATFESDGNSTIELAKSFIEGVCITLLTEFGQEVPKDESTTFYLQGALSVLGLRNTRGTDKFDKVLSAFNKLSDGLSDVRNQDGSVAHGKDGFLDTLTSQHARVFVLTADMIVSLLLMAYEGTEPSIRHTRDPHTRFRHLNDRIDRGLGLEAEVDTENGAVVISLYRPQDKQREEPIEIRASASELLYALDRQAYIDALDKLRGDEFEVEEPEADFEELPEELPIEPTIRISHEERARIERVAAYEGMYSEHLAELFVYLSNEFHFETLPEDKIPEFAATLLKRMEDLVTVDWKINEVDPIYWTTGERFLDRGSSSL